MLRILILTALLVPLTARSQTTNFVPLASSWKYLDNGTDQGTAWRAPGFDDSTWPAGLAELGYGDGGEATVVGYGPNAAAKYITTYFRKSFSVTNAAAYTAATLRVRRDDGVVIYLNGTEVYRNTMPAGTITYITPATAAIGGADESALQTATVNPALLVEGSNLLAVEIHQNAANSSDLSFDMEFTGTIPGQTPSANAQSVNVTEDTAQAITLTGSDPNGNPLTYTITSQPAKGTLTGAPPALTFTPGPNATGTDSFTFTVTDGTNTSATATVSLTIAGVNDLPAADAQSVTLTEDGSTGIVLSGSDVESPYGMLPHYTQQLHNGNLTAITDGLSGATWNAGTDTLFLIRNVSSGGGQSFEYTADGTLLRTITQTGFQDTEAITWMYGTTYAIAEENNNQRISIVTIAQDATSLERTAPGNVTFNTPVGSLLNLGIESLCYDAGRDRLYYLCEKPAAGAWPVYEMHPQTGATTVLCDLNTSVFTAGVAADLSDMAFDRATDTFLLLSHESSRIVRVSRSGTVLEQRGFTTALTQAEMLALTPDRQRLFVGGEPKQFTRLALPAANLTYQIITPPAHGSLSGIPPRLTYTPAPNFHGPDTLTFRVHDGTVGSPAATVTFNVTPANDPPAGDDTGISANAAEPVLIMLPVSDPDGDALTIQATQPSHGTLNLEGTTALYTAGYYNGPDSFTYTVADGEFTAGPFTVDITVQHINLPPAANDGTAETSEDTPAEVVLSASDTENDPLSWSIVTPPAHGMLSGTAPHLTFTPNADYHGPDSFTFRVHDGQEFSNTATFSLTIQPVNDAPLATQAFLNGAEDTTLSATLAAADADGDPLSFTVVAQPLHGTLSGTAPDLIYTPDQDWHGSDTFLFTAGDAGETSPPALVVIEIEPVNDAPVVTMTPLSTVEDTALSFVPSGTDADGDFLTFSITSSPAHGTLSGTPPMLVYTPDTNFSGTDSLEITAADGATLSEPVTLHITVVPANDLPVPAAQSLTTNEDAPLALTLTADDAENDALSFSIVTAPLHGTLSGTAPHLIYTPAANWHGGDSFTFTANDTEPAFQPAQVNITVAPVNDVPAAAAQAIAGPEDTPLAITLTGTDEDDSPLTFAVTTPPQHGTLSGTTPDLIYTPDPEWHGLDSFFFTVSDGTETSAPVHVTVGITPVNDTPLAHVMTLETVEDAAVNFTLTGTDADGDALTALPLTQPAHGTLSGTAPDLTYTPGPDWHGEDSFTFAVTDGPAVSASVTVAITVTPVNDQPVAAPLSLNGTEDGTLSVTLSATDADGDSLTYAVTRQPGHGTLSGSPPALVYTPDPDWHGLDSFSFTAADAAESLPPEAITIEIAPANDTPLASAGNISTSEDSPVSLSLTGSDADGDALSFTVTTQPAHGSLSGTAPDLIYTPDADWHGSDSFTFLTSDGTAGSAPVVFGITVTPVNDPPLTAGQSLSTEEDTPLPVTLSASDADADALTFTITAPPAHGTLSGTAPDLWYTPDANWSGIESFTYAVSDGNAPDAEATITVSVNAVNDAPVAESLTVSAEVGASVSFTLPGSDAEGDALTWEILTGPAYGTLSGTAPVLTCSPAPAYRGSDSFTFRVSDGSSISAAATVNLIFAPSGPWQLVLRTGQVAPGTAGAAVSVIQPDFVSDSAGRATFRAAAGTLTGIWTEGPAGLEPAMVQGAAAPGVAGAVFDAVTTSPWAAGDGELLLFGRMLAGTGGVAASSDQGYWLRTGGTAALVARENNPVPSLPAAARFNVLSAVATLEAGGNYAFAASVRTSSSLGITAANDTGIWGTFGSAQRLIVRESDAAPGGDGGLFDTLTGAALRSNGDGQLAFSTAMKVAGAVTTANRFGVWLWDPLQFGLVARGGNPAPGTPAGTVFSQAQQPSLGGALGFRATLSTAGGGVTSSTDTGLWTLENGTVNLLARESSQAPGIASGGLFNNLTEGPVVNREGHLTFRASLRTGGGVTSSTSAGVWSRSPYTGDQLIIVARKGSPAPGAGTGTFAAFDVPCLASDGSEAFTATLTQNSTTGVTTANDRGLWVRSAAGPLVLALREGSSFTLQPGDTRTVSAITLPSAQSSGRSPFSGNRRLLVLLTFNDSTTALYHYSLP